MDSASSEPQVKPQARIFRRQVFYLPGYDPFHPRRYRELYRKEARSQAAISGYEISQHAKTGAGPFGWHVTAKIDGRRCETDMQVLVWGDIVKASMAQGIGATYLQLVRTAWVYLGSGALFRLTRLRKGPTIAALYPVAFLLLQLTLALVAGFGVAGALSGLIHSAAGWVVGPPLVWLILRMFRRWDNRVYAYYLMHDYAYSAQARGAYPSELEARMRAFQGQIHAALQGGADEVLVVGHSSGAHLGVSILADLIRAGLPQGASVGRAQLAFLTLGHVVPMVSFLPEARRLRGDLAYLSARAELTWVDVTAPGDGCAFALCDPVAVTGVSPLGKRWPLVLSAAFTQTLSPERWKALRWRFFRLHFQYLCAFDRPGDYDYFKITAGPVSLADRYAGRAPSKSRIETPLSGYRTTL
jgi:hypothetical protein